MKDKVPTYRGDELLGYRVDNDKLVSGKKYTFLLEDCCVNGTLKAKFIRYKEEEGQVWMDNIVLDCGEIDGNGWSAYEEN